MIPHYIDKITFAMWLLSLSFVITGKIAHGEFDEVIDCVRYYAYKIKTKIR